jgi:aryl carrier-like protein
MRTVRGENDMNELDETSFIDTMTQFISNLRGKGHGIIGPDQNLAVESGLDSLQLIALLRHIEQLRGDELLDVPDLGDFTLRSAYSLLYKGESAAI